MSKMSVYIESELQSRFRLVFVFRNANRPMNPTIPFQIVVGFQETGREQVMIAANSRARLASFTVYETGHWLEAFNLQRLK